MYASCELISSILILPQIEDWAVQRSSMGSAAQSDLIPKGTAHFEIKNKSQSENIGSYLA